MPAFRTVFGVGDLVFPYFAAIQTLRKKKTPYAYGVDLHGDSVSERKRRLNNVSSKGRAPALYGFASAFSR